VLINATKRIVFIVSPLYIFSKLRQPGLSRKNHPFLQIACLRTRVTASLRLPLARQYDSHYTTAAHDCKKESYLKSFLKETREFAFSCRSPCATRGVRKLRMKFNLNTTFPRIRKKKKKNA